MTKTLLKAMLVAVAALAGCSHAVNKEPASELPPGSFKQQWARQFQMNPDKPRFERKVQWDKYLKEHGIKPRDMYVRGDTLFIYTTTNVLYRMNRVSGDVVFVSDVAKPGAQVKAPLILKDSVVVPTDTHLEFLDARGFRERTIDVRYPLQSGVVTDGTSFYVGVAGDQGSGRVVCVDVKRPYSPAQWELQTGGAVSCTPAFYGGVLYAGSDDGRVYAMTPDRVAAWGSNHGHFDTRGPIRGDITAEKSGVYVASADSKLYCLDPRDGKIRWQYYAQATLNASPNVTASSVYIHVNGRGLVALDKAEGKFNRDARWICPEATQFLAEDAGHCYARGRDNSILALDKKTGEIKFRSQRKDFVAFATNTVDGMIYGATETGQVVAVVAVLTHGEVGEVAMANPAEWSMLAAGR